MKALKIHERGVIALPGGVVPPATLAIPAVIDEGMMDATIASMDVVLLRCEATKQMVKAMRDQNNNSSIMISDLLLKKRKVEQDLLKMQEALGSAVQEVENLKKGSEQDAIALALLRKDVELKTSEKKQLEIELNALRETNSGLVGEKTTLEESLKTAQGDLQSSRDECKSIREECNTLTAKLTKAEADVKKYKDAVSDVWLETWNNAVQQLELRNWHLHISAEQCSPSYEVVDQKIVHRKRDGTIEVMWEPNYDDSDPEAEERGTILNAFQEGDVRDVLSEEGSEQSEEKLAADDNVGDLSRSVVTGVADMDVTGDSTIPPTLPSEDTPETSLVTGVSSVPLENVKPE